MSEILFNQVIPIKLLCLEKKRYRCSCFCKAISFTFILMEFNIYAYDLISHYLDCCKYVWNDPLNTFYQEKDKNEIKTKRISQTVHFNLLKWLLYEVGDNKK